MQNVFRQLLAMAAGAGVLAIALMAPTVFAQTTSSPDNVQPVALQGSVSQHDVIQYQGQLFNPATGQPLANTAVNASFRVYGQATGGTPLWQEDKVVSTNADGLFNSSLGDVNPLNFDVFDGRELHLGVAVNGEEGSPRLPVGLVPYAIWSRNADKLDGLGSDDLIRTVAYGVVDENGSRVKGDGFSSSVASDNVYEISVDGHSYNLNDYVTVVTPITQSGCSRPTIAGTNSEDGKLLVEMMNRDGSNIRCKFHFVVTQPD